jgi:hypothetical protein
MTRPVIFQPRVGIFGQEPIARDCTFVSAQPFLASQFTSTQPRAAESYDNMFCRLEVGGLFPSGLSPPIATLNLCMMSRKGLVSI